MVSCGGVNRSLKMVYINTVMKLHALCSSQVQLEILLLGSSYTYRYITVRNISFLVKPHMGLKFCLFHLFSVL